MAQRIDPDGTCTPIQNCSLRALQVSVGGLIDFMPTNDERHLVFRKGGRLAGLHLQHNTEATRLTRGCLPPDTFIVGPVVVAEAAELLDGTFSRGILASLRGPRAARTGV